MNNELKYVYLKSHPLFANISEKQIAEASELAKVKTVYRGETFDYGASGYSKVYLLIKGKIKITLCDELDNELIKDILTAPDIFGDLSLDGRPSADEFAQALMANTVVCSFTVGDFKKLMQENSRFCSGARTFAGLRAEPRETRCCCSGYTGWCCYGWLR